MIGWDWPFSPFWYVLLCVIICVILFIHGRMLLKGTLPQLAKRLISLRVLAVLFFLILLARPFVMTDQPNPRDFKILSLTDFSGSMNTRDSGENMKRIEQVRPFFSLDNDDSWINQMKNQYGKVESLGFSENLFRLNRDSWVRPEQGKKTALGDALSAGLKNIDGKESLGSVVVFSDGRNNLGTSALEIAKDFRSLGIPVNVVGVGREQALGDLGIEFADRKPNAVAKEELLLSAFVENKFEKEIQSKIVLMQGKKIEEEISLTLKSGEKRKLDFSPLKPKESGPKRYRVLTVPPSGDSDPSNDSDSILVLVKPPDQFSTLYLSNRVQPIYPFLKRTLANEERFDFKALVRMSEKVFHAFGDDIKPQYPADPSFWMKYDSIILDTNVLPDLNSSLMFSLKDFVQKKGGGLLMFGPLEFARENLGGLVPVKEVEYILAKENLSLVTLEEPLFSPVDEVEKMKLFLPKRLPGFFVKDQNQGAKGVVLSRSNGKAVLSVQAYGAGKVAYWGSPHDWRRSLEEKGTKEFRLFWQSLAQWLGTGGEDRLKTLDIEKPFLRGEDASLQVDALGADFEPSMDAMVEARISGPDNYNKVVQLYPQGSNAGRYAGTFRPVQAGAYEVNYILRFPDGEKLERENFIRVSEAGEEAVDISFARLDLQMLAKLTGGEYLPISDFSDNWRPKFAENLPTITKRHSLAEAWIFFIALFLFSGIEWIFRRQGGLR